MDMDDVQELVRRIRQRYVDQFVSDLGELAAASPGSSEVKYANVDSYYRNFIAVDFVANDGQPDPQFINSDTYLKFAPDIHAGIGGMDVHIAPFQWDEAGFKFDIKSLNADLFDEWFRSWFDIDGERETTEIVGNIIHSALLLDGQMTIDFGTAEADAFWHLLQILSRSGVRSLAIGTDDIAPASELNCALTIIGAIAHSPHQISIFPIGPDTWVSNAASLACPTSASRRFSTR